MLSVQVFETILYEILPSKFCIHVYQILKEQAKPSPVYRRKSAAAVLPSRCRFKIEDKTRTVEAVGRQHNCRTFFCESLLATGVQLDRYNDSKPKPRSRQKVRKSVGAHKVTKRKCFASDTAKIHRRQCVSKQILRRHFKLLQNSTIEIVFEDINVRFWQF